MKKIYLLLLITLGNFALLNAQNFSEIIKAVASDRTASDNLGYSVAISGDYAVVGAYHETDDNQSNYLYQVGAAYVYKKDEGGTDNWGEVKK